MTEPVKFWTKAIKSDTEPLAYRPHLWFFSRRAHLTITDIGFQCGDWQIPFDTVKEAVLYEFESIYFVKGNFLVVRTETDTYQFGLNPSSYWRGELPFKVKREQKGPGGLWFRRVIFFALITYIIFKEVFGNGS
ncbi:MAG: hypothetical protein P1V97_11875 [Planctomycetota bacterium]|nr:hypothetical protein [Planctomycetota bacterium]